MCLKENKQAAACHFSYHIRSSLSVKQYPFKFANFIRMNQKKKTKGNQTPHRKITQF
jgi:hypothetical protein